ncbi:hypothetical protein J3R30DRAFT_3703119 [Lentinula aciculospora]|uniref:Uncharacterized protein n=1 Tax=Lentinula aciculospora TaxID=153920 RepID=A0A9W9ABF9_9AGAR|nr:hypothetical protein J3R30DRAFT_3703119 [Lentinula aciculospora]
MSGAKVQFPRPSIVLEFQICGRPYLRLLDPSVSPPPVQRHAFSVLSYTISLKLSLLSFSTSQAQILGDPAATPIQVPDYLNALLQQMGLPPINHNSPSGDVQVIQQP